MPNFQGHPRGRDAAIWGSMIQLERFILNGDDPPLVLQETFDADE